jgi:3-methyl-2-oxobutanoate hydroxymethyltransferase
MMLVSRGFRWSKIVSKNVTHGLNPGRSSLGTFKHVDSVSGSRFFSKKTTALSLTSKKRHGKKITMVTAYDYPSAVHVARTGVDMILVGDSVAMVELGYDTTQPMTMEDMLHHCRSVKRGIDFAGLPSPLLVGDMPFGTYEFENTDIALGNAYRFVKEASCDAVKLEVSFCAVSVS